MLYHLFEYLDREFDLPGAGLFRYISFRAGLAIMLSLIISLLLGTDHTFFETHADGETVRDLDWKDSAKAVLQWVV
jgi:phospho-N-acetylmuramoyl-pentapeptide-transferase